MRSRIRPDIVLSRIVLYGIFFMASLTIPVSSFAQQATPESDNSLPVGQTLINQRAAFETREAELQSELDQLKAESSRLREKLSWHNGIVAGTISGVLKWSRKSTFLLAPMLCIWVLILIIQFNRIQSRERQQQNRRRIKALYIAFLVLGLLCLITATAPAQTIAVDTFELEQSLGDLSAYAERPEWEQILMALESEQCDEVSISEEVLAWLSTRCPVARITSPVTGSGPQRWIATAAIYWSSGQRDRAVTALAPFLEYRYRHRDESERSSFMSAIALYAEAQEIESTTALLGKAKASMGTVSLIWTAGIIRSCCYQQATECISLARDRARTAEEVIEAARALDDFARSDESLQYLRSKIRMTLDPEALPLFLTYAAEASLPDLEQDILAYAVDQQNSARKLFELAERLHGLERDTFAKRALLKVVEKTSDQQTLGMISSAAFQWQYFDVLEKDLLKLVNEFGFPVAMSEFPDPELLPASRTKPLEQMPSIGVVIAMLAEHRGDLETAGEYYSASLNYELTRAMNCLGFPQEIKFIDCYYACRFFGTHGTEEVKIPLDRAGRTLENLLLAQYSGSRLRGLERRIESEAKKHERWKSDLRQARLKFFLQLLAAFCLVLFLLAFITILIFAHYVIIQRVAFHTTRLRHFRFLGASMKLVELEGFVLLGSIFLLPAAILLIIIGQLAQVFLYTENHQYRISGCFTSTAGMDLPDIPVTYREEEGKYEPRGKIQ